MRSIAVVTGGTTPERDVALAGAAQVVAALRQRSYDVTAVDTVHGELHGQAETEFLASKVGVAPPTPDELRQLRRHELGTGLVDIPAVSTADVVFLVLHGDSAEGGTMQALLEMSDICYTGSNPLGSALAMDKDICKRLLRASGIPTPDWRMWSPHVRSVEELGTPLVVKPSKVGSSVGLTVLHEMNGLDAAVETALKFDDEVILERFVDGQELTVGILEDRALGVGEIIPNNAVFDYECKYTPGMCEEVFPARIDGTLTERIQALGLAVHVALKLRDFSRVDFRVAEDGTPYCLEANTLPGLTATSLLPQSAQVVGIEFGELCESICRSAFRRHSGRNK